MLENLKSSLKNIENNLLNDILNDCVSIVQDCIQEYVYDFYSPTWYERTNNLKDSVKGEVKNGVLYIYHDNNMLDYKSQYKSLVGDISPLIPYIIDYSGHQARNYIGDNNMFNYYPSFGANMGRKYLDVAKSRIKSKYDVDVEIIGR